MRYPIIIKILGMMAKEFGDVALWRKLRNSIDKDIYQKVIVISIYNKGGNNPIYNAPLLCTSYIGIYHFSFIIHH